MICILILFCIPMHVQDIQYSSDSQLASPRYTVLRKGQCATVYRDRFQGLVEKTVKMFDAEGEYVLQYEGLVELLRTEWNALICMGEHPNIGTNFSLFFSVYIV